MPLYGRRDSPDEDDIGDALDQKSVLDRTIRAQVRSVDAENGIVILIYENMPGGGKYTTIKPLWISFPDAKIGNPAWGRFIPQEGDLVRVTFDYDDRPVIVGYDIAAELADVGDGLSGWPALQEQYKSAKDSSAPGNKAKFAQFTPLKPGEYDFMSSGGAYVYGNNQGRLYLAGGNVSVTLIKNDLRISQRAQLLTHSADNCELRFGQIRRTNPTNQLEEKISADSAGAFKEFSVVVKKTVSSSETQDLATLKLGNVVDETGTVLAGEEDYRVMIQSFVDAGTESLKMSMDKLGNWDVLAPTHATTGVTFDFSAGNWITKFKEMTHQASVSFTVETPEVLHDASTSFTVQTPQAVFDISNTWEANVSSSFTVNCSTIKFQGGTGSPAATHPLFLSNTYKQAESDMVTDLAQQVANLAQDVVTLATTLSTFSVSQAAASVPPILAALKPGYIALGAGVGSVIGTSGTVNAQAPIIATTFTAQYDTYLSTIAKTG